MVYLQSWVAFNMRLFSEAELFFLYSCFTKHYGDRSNLWLKAEDGFGWTFVESIEKYDPTCEFRYGTYFYPHPLV